MVAEVVAPLVDAIVGLIALIGELLLSLFSSCVRSLRYAFSREYRKSVDGRLSQHGSLYRIAYASWGIIAVAATLAAMAAFVHWLAKPGPTPAEACAELKWRQLSECAQAVREALPK